MVVSKLRVLVAAESPAVRRLLLDVVGEEPDGVVVGEAVSSGRAIALARTLRPDVALVDCHLPQTQGIDFNRLSRIGGLDTALAISQEVRSTQAIVLVNLDEAVSQEDALTLTPRVCLFYREEGTDSVAVTLGELRQEASLFADPVFANLQMEERGPERPKVVEVAENIFFASSLALLGGLGLIATFLLAPIGAAVALLGLAGLFLSAAMHLVASVWPKRFSSFKVSPASRSDLYDLVQETTPVQGTWDGRGNGRKSV